MRRVLIAPTAFKGTLSPTDVAAAIENGIRDAFPYDTMDVIVIPIADGGDGTVETVHRAIGGEIREEQVLGPTGVPTTCPWLKIAENSGLVELASACGLAKLPNGVPDALGAHTFGLGQVIMRAHEFGCTDISIAVGGSASTDGGMGALRALGAVFFDDAGNEIEALGGGALHLIHECDLTPLRWIVKNSTIRVLTDVDNPLLGETGAAAIFGPQKGATPEQVRLLDEGLRKFANVLEAASDANLRDAPGAGAAGGTAFGLACALNASIVSGFDWIAQAANLDEHLANVDVVFTGEGCFDSQSLNGKATGKLIERALRDNKKICVVSATTAEDAIPSTEQITVLVPEPGPDGLVGRKEIRKAIEIAVPRIFHK